MDVNIYIYTLYNIIWFHTEALVESPLAAASVMDFGCLSNEQVIVSAPPGWTPGGKIYAMRFIVGRAFKF